MDYGMENCTIALSFPPVGSTSFQNSTVDVWLLESERGIDFSHLNWNSKPIRQLSLGTFISIQNSTQQTMGYSCKTGTTQIIELSCRAVDCNIHVPAGGHDAIGLYVQQFQTI
ncbi:hypothetical protein BDN70DRAFT_984119 [Pholiota conissans]|uniref:Ubiquitin 3 binding protein But2 C-terminal domain-containing protein n=1 Tax=Pholiota conissans TaxID=109636 RepID=A0A9P5Z3Q9_9AGAR|nr:hypothetical protein BDN70DRAFT_984119 [Pholiota conissans]